MPSALFSLNSYASVKLPDNTIRGTEIIPILGYATLVEDFDMGILYFRGNRYNLQAWKEKNGTHEPPGCISCQGRYAKEQYNIFNNKPEISIITQRGETLNLDACPCGGRLIYDSNAYLFCEVCGKIYSDC
jgi:hypothetical protein